MAARPIETLPAGELNRRLERANERSRLAIRALVDAGRGSERCSETRAATDPLALAWQAAEDTARALYDERQARRRYHGSDKPIRRALYG